MKNIAISSKIFLALIVGLGAGCGETKQVAPSSVEIEVVQEEKLQPATLEPAVETSKPKPKPMLEPKLEPAPTPVSPPKVMGLYAFDAFNPGGGKSRTIVIDRRTAPSGHGVATLQIERSSSTTLMDIGFDCAAERYAYLYMDHNAGTVDAAKMAKVQGFSDRQLSAFQTGEALQRLTFSDLNTMPPEDIEHFRKIMAISCAP